MNTNYYFS